jgi:glycosyltransferase involved in cell wall biosynthesis
VILAVDAYNLAADRRGMGRSVRRVLAGLRALDEAEVWLVVRDRRKAAPLQTEFEYRLVERRDLLRERVTAVWYPWNGMRFEPHAPAIVTLHDPFAFTFPHPNFWARRREQAPIARAIKTAAKFLAVSDWTKGEYLRLFGVAADRIEVVPNVPDPFWHRVETHSDRPYFLFVGGPEPRKNAATLLGAFHGAFAVAGPELVVAGTLNDADERACGEIASAHRVRANDERLRELYSGALAVLVPSIAEGFGFSAIEAMACGAPVIASDAAALPETCAGAALLIPPLDEAGWRDAMRRVAEDARLREELRERGLTRVAGIDPATPAKALLRAVRS